MPPNEPGEAVMVLRKVARHPVEDHADAVAMAHVDEVAEVVGRAESARWRKEPDDLIPPRSGERMLHHRHQLDVREAHLTHVGNELIGKLAVGQIAMALIP